MKQIIVIAVLILGITATHSLAQMGHGMMRGGHMTDEKGMTGDKEYKQLDDIFTRQQKPTDEMPMHHHQMMNGMMGAAQDIAIMMRQMSVMMGNITATDGKPNDNDMQKMSAMMKNMATEMNRISGMMSKGAATPEEIRAMQDRMIKMQEQLWELKR